MRILVMPWHSQNDSLHEMGRLARKPTVWSLRKVSTRISLTMPGRRTRIDTFRLLWIFCFRNHSLQLSP